jgi:hypothetical protein
MHCNRGSSSAVNSSDRLSCGRNNGSRCSPGLRLIGTAMRVLLTPSANIENRFAEQCLECRSCRLAQSDQSPGRAPALVSRRPSRSQNSPRSLTADHDRSRVVGLRGSSNPDGFRDGFNCDCDPTSKGSKLQFSLGTRWAGVRRRVGWAGAWRTRRLFPLEAPLDLTLPDRDVVES